MCRLRLAPALRACSHTRWCMDVYVYEHIYIYLACISFTYINVFVWVCWPLRAQPRNRFRFSIKYVV